MLWAYLGPETILPVASFIAGAVGVVLMAGHRIRSWVVRGYRACCGQRETTTPER